jgi:hypothetical protein
VSSASLGAPTMIAFATTTSGRSKSHTRISIVFPLSGFYFDYPR